MRRLLMLCVVAGSSCGTFFNVGDNGTNQDDLIGGQPVDSGQQCGPVCAIYCEHGNVLDANGCPTCACNPPPTPDAGQCGPVCAIYCEHGNVLDSNGCATCACNPPPVPDAGQQCGPVCAIYCEFGNVLDSNGCPTCACNPPPAVKCGENTCAAGEECCNSSCGICVPPGGVCTQQACARLDAGACNPVVCTLACQYGFARGPDGCEVCACNPAPQACGKTTCGAGLECCNASCGICVPPGWACTQQACN